jgi:hypothetical protein
MLNGGFDGHKKSLILAGYLNLNSKGNEENKSNTSIN